MLAIYTRLSREDEASNSINNQLREGKAFAKDNGFTQIEIYNEGEGISGGANIKDRPQLFQLLQDITDNKVTAVWFRNQDRLERNSNTYIIFIGECKKHNCKVYFGNQEFDLDDPQANLLGQIRSAVNQYQKDLQSVKTKKSLRDSAQEGKVWSVVAYGYKSDNGYLAINESESKIVEKIYNWSLSGIGIDKIANNLNKEKVPTRKNKKWAGKTVQSIIKNTLYKGERNYGGEVFESPIIINPILWQKVNDNLEKNSNNSGVNVDHKYLLKKLLKCGKCERNYYGRRRVSLKDNYYQCSSRRFKDKKDRCGNRGINIDVLEHFIWQRFFADKRILELTKDFLKDDEVQTKLSRLRDEQRDLIKHLQKLEKRLQNALDLLLDETISKEQYNKTKASNKIDRNTTQARLNNIAEQIDFYERSELTTEAVNSDLKRLEGASFNDKRDLIKKYIERITILYNGSIKMYTIRVDFKISNYFPKDISNPILGNLNIKSDKLTEVYLIDRNYDLAIDIEFKFIFPLSSKAINEIGRKSILSYEAKSQNEVSIDVTNFKVWNEFMELKNSLREL